MIEDFKRPVAKKKLVTAKPNVPLITPKQAPISNSKPQTVDQVQPDDYNQEHIKMNKDIKGKRRGLMLFSFLVVFIAASAIVVVAYFYLQSQKDKPAPYTSQNVILSQESQETAGEIDDLTTEIDTTLQASDEEIDFDSTQLDDSAIGL